MAGSRTLFIYEVDMEEYRGYTINLVLGKSFQGMYEAYVPEDRRRTLVESCWFNLEDAAGKQNAYTEIKEMIDICLKHDF